MTFCEEIIGRGQSGDVILKDGYVYKNITTVERSIHTSLNHENIVKMIDGKLELCESTLSVRLFESTSDSQLIFWMYELATAVAYLHKNNILHRDIKPDNIYLLNGHIKLGDFGYATTADAIMTTHICGTPNFMAPEIAAAALNDEIEPKFSFSSDCWSIGCCMHTMFTGVPPFQGKNINDTLLNIITYGKLYSDAQNDLLRGRYVLKDMCELMVHILSMCPTDRPTAAQIADRCLEIYFLTMKKELDFIG